MADDAQSPATKQDVKLLMEQMARMQMSLHERMDKLVDEKKLDAAIRASEKRTKEYFDFYTGKLHKDFLGATEDELQILKETDTNHEVRITKLEQHASLSAA